MFESVLFCFENKKYLLKLALVSTFPRLCIPLMVIIDEIHINNEYISSDDSAPLSLFNPCHILRFLTINLWPKLLKLSPWLISIVFRRFKKTPKIIHCLVKYIAGVHDSFWTHACDVDEMNQILRKKFVELYSMPILENVSILDTHVKSFVVVLEYLNILAKISWVCFLLLFTLIVMFIFLTFFYSSQL